MAVTGGGVGVGSGFLTAFLSVAAGAGVGDGLATAGLSVWANVEAANPMVSRLRAKMYLKLRVTKYFSYNFSWKYAKADCSIISRDRHHRAFPYRIELMR